MPVEIERKFLVAGDGWRRQVVRSELFRQGYLATTATSSVRVRVGGGRGWLGIKGRVVGPSRAEYEYEIPLAEANEILDTMCDEGRLEKYRHWAVIGDREWEIDEFLGDNAGLVVAEVELDDVGEVPEMPPWTGREVTDDVRFYNFSLAERPWPSFREAFLREAGNQESA